MKKYVTYFNKLSQYTLSGEKLTNEKIEVFIKWDIIKKIQ